MWGWMKIRWAMSVKHHKVKFQSLKINLKASSKIKKIIRGRPSMERKRVDRRKKRWEKKSV